MNIDHDSPSFEELRARKIADRAQLAAMPPDEAQAEVERILHPRLWHLQNPSDLDWPGDLADELELTPPESETE